MQLENIAMGQGMVVDGYVSSSDTYHICSEPSPEDVSQAKAMLWIAPVLKSEGEVQMVPYFPVSGGV